MSDIDEKSNESWRRAISHHRTASKWINEDKELFDLFIFAYATLGGYIQEVRGNKNAIYAFLIKLIATLAKEENRSFNDVIASMVVIYHNAAAKNEDKIAEDG